MVIKHHNWFINYLLLADIFLMTVLSQQVYQLNRTCVLIFTVLFPSDVFLLTKFWNFFSWKAMVPIFRKSILSGHNTELLHFISHLQRKGRVRDMQLFPLKPSLFLKINLTEIPDVFRSPSGRQSFLKIWSYLMDGTSSCGMQNHINCNRVFLCLADINKQKNPFWSCNRKALG